MADDSTETLLSESRASYETQIATIESIDDKAMRTVRTTVLILGFLVSAVGIAGPDSVSNLSVFATVSSAVGVVGLLAAGVYGVGIYTVTEYEPGVGPKERARARRLDAEPNLPDDEGQQYLLEMYDRWAQDLAREIRANAAYLENAQATLLLGSAALLYGAVLFTVRTAYHLPPYVVVLATAGVVLLAFAFVSE
jgi:hypothetical protein